MSVKLLKSVQEQTDSVKTLWIPSDPHPRVSKTDGIVLSQFPKQANGGRPIKQSAKHSGNRGIK